MTFCLINYANAYQLTNPINVPEIKHFETERIMI